MSPAVTMNELRAQNTLALLRKFRELFAFVAPADAPVIESLTDADGQFQALPEEYVSVGLLDKEAGFAFPREVESSTETAVGYGGSIRRDYDSDTTNVTFTAMETKKAVLELAYGLDLSGHTMSANGEVVIDRPSLPDDIARRMLLLGYDPKHQIGAGMWLPRFEIAEFPEISWGPNAATTYQINGEAMPDDDLGFSIRDFPVCGPGALRNAARLGFGQPTTGG